MRSGVAFCPSIDQLERAWQDAYLAVPSEVPYLEVEVPVGDRLLADRRRLRRDDDVHPVRAVGRVGLARRRARGVRRTAASTSSPRRAPNVRDAVIHREVLAPPDLERILGLIGGSIFQGEQRMDQSSCARRRRSPVLDADRRSLSVRRRHASRRRRVGARRPQRGAAGAAPTSAGAARADGCGRRCRCDRRRRGTRGRRPRPRLRRGASSSRSEEKAERGGGRLPDEDIARIRVAAIEAGLAGGLHAREHGGQGWSKLEWVLVEEQFGRSTNALSWHVPSAYNVLGVGLRHANRPLSAPGAARRAARRVRGHRGEQGQTRRASPRGRRAGEAGCSRARSGLSRRRRGHRLHRGGTSQGRPDAVPRRPTSAASRWWRPDVHPLVSARAPDDRL